MGQCSKSSQTPHRNPMNWLLGLSHFIGEEKWDRAEVTCPPGFESRIYTPNHDISTFPMLLSISTIPFQKTGAIHSFLWEADISTFAPHWTCACNLRFIVLIKPLNAQQTLWAPFFLLRNGLKVVKDNNAVESRFEPRHFWVKTMEFPFYCMP